MASVTYNIHSVLDKDDWNFEEVKKFLERDSSSINCFNHKQQTPLLCVLKKENCTAEVIKLLLEYGADLNCENKYNPWTIDTLTTALDFPGREDIIKLLIENGVNLYVGNPNPICHALSRGASKGLIELLLDAGCPTDRCTHASVLHCALSYPKSGLKPDIFYLLLDRGPDVETLRGSLKNRPVMCHALYHSNEASTIQLLIDAGIPLNECPYHTSSLFCVTDAIMVDTPLKAEMVKLLIQSGACVNDRDQSGLTPLECALQYCKCETEVIRLFLDCSPDSDKNLYLHAAMCNAYCCPKVLKFLIKLGAEVDGVNKNGESALHLAVRNMHGQSVIKALLESKAEINLENIHGESPLIVAINCIRGFEIFEELLIAGAYIKHCMLYYSMKRLLCRIDDCLAIKVFLRYFFLQNFFFDIEGMFRLGRHSKELLKFRDECKHELQKMKLKQIGEDFTLYEFISEYASPRADSVACELPGKKYYFSRLLKTIGDNSYSLYFGIISGKVGTPSILRMLEEVQVYTVSYSCDNPSVEKKIVLNYETVCNIARFSTGDDLLRMILAFYNPHDNPCSGQASNEKNNHSEKKAECVSKCDWPKLH